jgi:hypothetical protein
MGPWWTGEGAFGAPRRNGSHHGSTLSTRRTFVNGSSGHLAEDLVSDSLVPRTLPFGLLVEPSSKGLDGVENHAIDTNDREAGCELTELSFADSESGGGFRGAEGEAGVEA